MMFVARLSRPVTRLRTATPATGKLPGVPPIVVRPRGAGSRYHPETRISGTELTGIVMPGLVPETLQTQCSVCIPASENCIGRFEVRRRRCKAFPSRDGV